jgi:hypothetical protein
VIPTVYNQGTGLIGSSTGGAAIPSNVDDLIINDTLLVGGEATFNGAVTINNALTVSGLLTFQDVTIQGTFILEGKTPTQLAFYTTGGELTGTADMTYNNGVTTLTNVTVTNDLLFGALQKTDGNYYNVALFDTNRVCVSGSPNTLRFQPNSGTLSCRNIAASGTISGIFDILAENKSDSTNYPISFHDTSTDRVCIGDANYLSSFTYNPSTRTMVLETGQITTATILSATLFFATISDCNISANSKSDDVEYKVVLLGPADNRICEDSLNNITYNPLNQRLSIVKLTASDDVTLTNGDLTMSNGRLTAQHLTLSGRTDLGTIVTIQGLNTVSSNTTYPLLVWDINGVAKTINVDSDLYYDTSDDTLHAPNFSGTFNIVAQTRTDPTDYPVLFYDSSTTDVCIDEGTTAFTYNPNSNTLNTRNMDVAVDLTTEKVTLDTGNIFNHSTNVYMGFKAISNNGTDLSGIGYNIALWQDGHVRLIGRFNQRFYIYNPSTGLTTQRLHVNDDGANVEGTIRNGTLPINYVQTFTCRDDGTQAAYVAQDTLNGWGAGTGVFWRSTAAQGASPTIYQYGANIFDNTVTPILRGAIDFQNDRDKFFLTNNDYAGWWYVDIDVLWQNTSSVRLMPRIDLGKQLTPTSAIVTEPQVGQSAGYTRNESGEVTSLHLSGPIYMASTDNRFGIRTYLVNAAGGIAIPPNWNDQTLDFRGLGLTISCKYLGLANNAGETVNAL